ncbi:MAG TPA: hypothetical protein VJ183_18335 [Chloroflexia bacterium]|nr:hypothetical protein [Chloroflexia bacterium]
MSSKFGFESATDRKARLRQMLLDRTQKIDRDICEVMEDWCRVQGWEDIQVIGIREPFIDLYLKGEMGGMVAAWSLKGSGRYWPEEITYWDYDPATRREFAAMPQKEREQLEKEHLSNFTRIYDVKLGLFVRPDMSESITVEWSDNIKYFDEVNALYTVLANTLGVAVYFNTKRYLEKICGDCEGSGYRKCPDCLGRGVSWEQPSSVRRTRCSSCNGNGRRECEECERTGKKVGPEEQMYVCNPQSEPASGL